MKKHLYIFLTSLFLIFFSQAAGVECAASEANYRPWSGYWWPLSQGGLVTGSDYNKHPAPLEKYDYVTGGIYYGPATSYGQANYYQPGCPSWYGMCFCWAAASILEEEPAHKGIYNGTRFNVGDKKGLLTVAYDGVPYNTYSTDSPLDFHHALEELTPVIMDLGTENEVWNHPVFKYETPYTQVGNTRHYTRHYTTTIYYISDMVHPDYVGSSVREATYYYYFVVEDGEITASDWEYGSDTNHPKNAREPYPYPDGTQGRNPGIDLDEVIKIVTTDGDAYQGNNSFENAASVSNDRYSLILSAVRVEDPSPNWVTYSDYFQIVLKAGDVLHVRVEAVDRNLGIILRSYNQDRELIQETEIPGLGSGEQVVAVNTTGDYFIEIAPMGQSVDPDDYEEPGYELFLRQALSYQAIFPVDPSGSWATDVALLKPDSSEGRTIISQINRDGLIQAGYTDNSSVRHLSGFETDFGLSRPDQGYLKVDSDTPVLGLQVITCGDYLMLGGSLISSASANVFFPHFDKTGGWQTLFGLINLGDQTEEIVRQSYDLNGDPVASDTIELAPGQKVEADASYLSIIKTGSGCMSASTVSGRDALAGYIKFLNPSNGSKGRALVPLSMRATPTLVAPHIASDGYWWTGIAVMNSGSGDSTVAIYAYDKEGKQIGYIEQLLRARQNFVRMVSGIFPGVPAKDIATIKFVSSEGQSLCGLLLYGSSDGLQLAGLPLLPSIVSPVYLPHVSFSDSWWTGIGLMNTGDAPTDVQFSLFRGDGEILASTMRRLNPAQRLAITIRDLFGGENISPSARYLKIDSPQPLSGIYLIGTNDGLRLMGDVIR